MEVPKEYTTGKKKTTRKRNVVVPPPAFEEACDALSTTDLFISDALCIRYIDIDCMFKGKNGKYKVEISTESADDDGKYQSDDFELDRKTYYTLALRWAAFLEKRRKGVL